MSEAVQYIVAFRHIGRPNQMTPHTGFRVGAKCGVVISHGYGPLSTTDLTKVPFEKNRNTESRGLNLG